MLAMILMMIITTDENNKTHQKVSIELRYKIKIKIKNPMQIAHIHTTDLRYKK